MISYSYNLNLSYETFFSHRTPICFCMILLSESSEKYGSDGLNLQSEELKVAMRYEIGSQAWEAPPEDFIRML